MKMEFDNGNLSIENANGSRWQLANVPKPRLSFNYDALYVTQTHAVRRVGAGVQPLSKKEVEEVAAFVALQTPPARSARYAADLKIFAYGLISTVVAQFEFGNIVEMQVAGRAASTDMRAAKARQALAYVDTVWNAYLGLVAQLGDTAEEDLLEFNDYANMMPMVPTLEQFASEHTRTTNEMPRALSGEPKGKGRSRDLHINGFANDTPGKPVTLEFTSPEAADFSTIVGRAFVFDDFFPSIQLQGYANWAMQSPHWMLANSSHDENGQIKHRIWGASFIESWRRKGWAGLPPVMLSIIATIFQRLDITITDPEYIGLNGQSKDQTASMHTDCAADSPDDLSILVYFGEDTDGDLLLYDKTDETRQLHAIAFKPNRVVAFDGSIPHQALAPTDDKFRMSMIIRGKYKVGATDLLPSRGSN